MIERKGFKTAQRGKRNSSLTQPELFPQCCVSKGPTAPTLLVETETCSGWFVARLCHTNLNPLEQHLWMGFFFARDTGSHLQFLLQLSSVMPSSSSPQTSTAEKISATSTAKQHTKAKITMHFCWDCKKGRRRTLISAVCFLLFNTSVKTRPECPNLGPPISWPPVADLTHSSAVYNMIQRGNLTQTCRGCGHDLACSGFHMKTWDGTDEKKGKGEEREQGREREREREREM